MIKFRYARHTQDLKSLEEFYTNVIGLTVLERFENHSNYNGVFLGFPDMDWHLEFTENGKKVNHIPDDDDLLVFYLDSIETIDDIVEKAKAIGIGVQISQNPYWQKNGIELKDPDGFGVVLVLYSGK